MNLTQIFKSITKREWYFVLGLSLAMIFITTAVLVYGWLITPDGQVFTGVHFAAPNDWFVYYSHIEQVLQGRILFKNLFASELQLETINIFWLSVGGVAKLFNLSPLVVLNLIRILLIPIFYFLAYLFLAFIFSDVNKRKISVLLLSFGSGLGLFLVNRIITYPFNFSGGVFQWPMDLWVPEAITFLTLYYSPHFIASLILILGIFFLTILFSRNKKFSYSLTVGLAAFILFAFHPFHVLTIFSVIFTYFVILMIKEKKILWHLVKHYLILGLFSAPSILYYLYLVQFDYVVGLKALQNTTFTPPVWITLFSFGLLLVFGILGIYFLIKEKRYSYKTLFILAWVVVQSLIIFLPVNYQRRMVEGLHIPLVILTTISLFSLYRLIKKQNTSLTKFLYSQRYALMFILTLFLISSNVFQLAVDSFIYRNQREVSYLDQEVVSAAGWLKSVDEEAIIFNSARRFINIVPAYSGRKVYVGHGVETPFFAQKQEEVNWFFRQDRAEEIEINFLTKRQIDYIFYSQVEKELGTYSPATKLYLKEVYSNSQVSIYQVL